MNDKEIKIKDIKSDNTSLFYDTLKICSDFLSEFYNSIFEIIDFDVKSSDNGSNNTEK